jgi:hypothetical protein
VRLLPGYELPLGGVYAVYAGQPTVKVRSFIDLLKERMGTR